MGTNRSTCAAYENKGAIFDEVGAAKIQNTWYYPCLINVPGSLFIYRCLHNSHPTEKHTCKHTPPQMIVHPLTGWPLQSHVGGELVCLPSTITTTTTTRGSLAMSGDICVVGTWVGLLACSGLRLEMLAAPSLARVSPLRRSYVLPKCQ